MKDGNCFEFNLPMAITSRVITALEIMTKDGTSKNWNMSMRTENMIGWRHSSSWVIAEWIFFGFELMTIIIIITTERKTWNNNIVLNLSNNLFYFYFHLLFWIRRRLPWKFSLLGLGVTFRFRKSLSVISLKFFYFQSFSDFENFHFQKIRKFSEKFFTYKIISLKIFYFHTFRSLNLKILVSEYAKI